eukprot:55406-Eustigmatos_ZCMA.PRE.2
MVPCVNMTRLILAYPAPGESIEVMRCCVRSWTRDLDDLLGQNLAPCDASGEISPSMRVDSSGVGVETVEPSVEGVGWPGQRPVVDISLFEQDRPPWA